MTKAKLSMYAGTTLTIETIVDFVVETDPQKMFCYNDGKFSSFVVADFILRMNPFDKVLEFVKLIDDVEYSSPIKPIEFVVVSTLEKVEFAVVKLTNDHPWEVIGTELFADQLITEIHVTIQPEDTTNV